MTHAQVVLTADTPTETAPRSGLGGLFAWPTAVVLGIMLLAAVLNFANLDALGDGNTYYTAAIEAMLQSPSNFFFVAAEPGGSVTIDKPPLGLWIQAVSAFFLGVNGFAVTLPQILAGIFAVPVMYGLVKRWFGIPAGLVAALVMAITPISVAVQRNNTMDATLIFTLLLATWAFFEATEARKPGAQLRWLVLGGVLVGLGFNIKMMQAFLPVPALFALYFFGAKTGWGRKVVHLALTTGVLLAVSLAWLIAVDLTPADLRPYVGSSENNSAIELAIGYNGVQRLLGGMGGGGGNAASRPDDAGQPPAGFEPPAGAPPNGGPQGGGMFSNEVGTAGLLRLVTQPLDNEAGWLLPFALLGLGLALVARPALPLRDEHKGAVLWGGWLLTAGVFFSVAGFFHAYYLAMLTPAVAALVGIGVARLWQQREQIWALALLSVSVGATLAFQMMIAAGYTNTLWWLVIPAALLVLASGVLLVSRLNPSLIRLTAIGFTLAVLALTATPTVWSALGTLEATANVALPTAYAGDEVGQQPGGVDGGMADDDRPYLGGRPDDGDQPGGGFGSSQTDSALIEFLQANTAGMRYMVAVPSSQQGAGMVLATGRGVLYMGGFSGSDPVVDAADLQALVAAGELRYVLSSDGLQGGGPGGGPGMGTHSDVRAWLTEHCTVVSGVGNANGTLYDCGVGGK